MTQLEYARQDILTDEMKQVAAAENIAAQELLQAVKDGVVVIPKNVNHKFKTVGIGRGLTTKINANIGTSRDCQNIDYELKKLEIAEKYGANAIMDLSTGGDLDKIRKLVIEKSSICV
ncbi:MAG TPA: phosphomethylpyrimidine synthase ThiC, partial [bacterium]|nr:phosphomethylpyrimidine synthase ThiC [bacterium]